MLWSFTILAQEKEGIEEAPLTSVSDIEIPKAPNPSFLKFFWEFPNYSEKYEIARNYTWTEVSHGGEAYVLFSHFRTKDKGDTDDFVGALTFRPLIFDFGSFSIAIGVAYGADFSSGEERDSAESSNDLLLELEGTPPLQLWYRGDSARGTETQALINIFGFSSLASFPELGMQIAFDCGYSWTKFTVDVERISGNLELVFDQAYPIPLIYEDYRYRQKQEGLFVRFEIKKLYIRNYLNYISLSFFNIYNIKTTQRISRAGTAIWDLRSLAPLLGPDDAIQIVRKKVDLPSVIVHPNPLLAPYFVIDLPDPQDGKATERSSKIVTSNMVTVDLTVRLYTIPFELPSFIFKFKTQGISLDYQCSLSHTTGELFEDDLHGIGFSSGGQLSIFDIFFIGGSYTWQMNNDQPNSSTIFFGVGLYG